MKRQIEKKNNFFNLTYNNKVKIIVNRSLIYTKHLIFFEKLNNN